MNKSLELLKEAKTKTIERFIEEAEIQVGNDLSRGKFDITEIRDIIYKEINKIAEREFRSSF